MKILIFNGSPKKDASDTMHMTRAFLSGMNDVSENDVNVIHVIDKHIEYCKGCLTCKMNGGHCVIHDDMEEILQQILSADMLLLSFGLYNYAMPAPLKNLWDRTMPLSALSMRQTEDRIRHDYIADFSKLRYVMICGAGFPNARNNFEGIIRQFALMFPANRTAITVPESPMFSAPEAAVVTGPFLEVMRQAGREYAQSGSITPETMEKLDTPMIPEEVYISIVNENTGAK